MESSIIVPSRSTTRCAGYCSVFFQSCTATSTSRLSTEAPSNFLDNNSSDCTKHLSEIYNSPSICTNNSKLCVMNVKTRFKVNYANSNNNRRIFFVDNTNLHSVPRNCTGILVAFCCSYVANGSEERYKWRLGIILLHTIERTIIFETSAMKESVRPNCSKNYIQCHQV